MELIESLSGFIIGMLVGSASLYLTAYLKEKGKSLALQEDVRALEGERQKIISMHQKEIEDVKRLHQLDIEKRKYRYESKNLQYFQFMQEVDEFNGCVARVITNELSQVMLEFYGSTSNVSGLSGGELTVKFNEMASSSVNSVKNQTMKLYSGLNALKLSANDEIILLLEEMIVEMQKTEKSLVDIFNYIGSPGFQMSRKVPEHILKISDSNKSGVASVKEKLMAALRRDLDEI